MYKHKKLLKMSKKVRDGLRVPCGHLFAKQRSNDRGVSREIELSSPGPGSLMQHEMQHINKTNTTKFLKKRQKKRETGCGCPVDTSLRSKEATTEAEAEKSNLRARDWARLCNKNGHLLRYPFYCIIKARDGDRTRDPLLGKEVLHH